MYSDGRPLYVVVEKILGPDEELPDWPVAGTTGYDFLVMLNGLFVDPRNETALNERLRAVHPAARAASASSPTAASSSSCASAWPAS